MVKFMNNNCHCCLSFLFIIISVNHAFIVPKSRFPLHSTFHWPIIYQPLSSSLQTRAFSLPTTATRDSLDTTVESLKEEAEALMIQSNGKVDIETLDPLLERIEVKNTVKEPNRDPNFKGLWHVWYTNCPPPSNGQLGPFQGSAEQDIAMEDDGYYNILRLPANAKDGSCWLNVVLDGRWEDWDGRILPNGNKESLAEALPLDKVQQDWGASYWKVTFLRLNFDLFGNRILSKEFPAGVARVWRSTYLDADTKIVRAGRTGRTDDECVFYMKRFVRPTN